MPSTLDLIRDAVAAASPAFSDHAYDRLAENGISPIELVIGIVNAVEIEDYPDAYKGPSVLVLQFDALGHPVHVVWGLRKGTIRPAVVVTSYRPDPTRWSADFRRRL